MDKFAVGNPSDNNFFGTFYESDYHETPVRYGGDLKGLESVRDFTLASVGRQGRVKLRFWFSLRHICCTSPDLLVPVIAVKYRESLTIFKARVSTDAPL
jgi:hypothetical protein